MFQVYKNIIIKISVEKKTRMREKNILYFLKLSIPVCIGLWMSVYADHIFFSSVIRVIYISLSAD